VIAASGYVTVTLMTFDSSRTAVEPLQPLCI